MKKTVYTLEGNRFGRSLCFAVVSDLHGQEPRDALRILEREHPDFILMPGDIFEALDGVQDVTHEHALTLLRESARIAPTVYATGNHEDGAVRSWSSKWKRETKMRCYAERDLEQIQKTGVLFLNNAFALKNGIAFGGLSSGLIHENRVPDTAWLSDFCHVEAPKILLCHHPEYYEPYLRELPLDLIVSGHAHGGQWRFFGRGVFAPGQGIFPRYTAGVHEDRFVISTGLKKSGMIPRIFNEPEIVLIKA